MEVISQTSPPTPLPVPGLILKERGDGEV